MTGSILLTGGTGSFGRAFIRTLLAHGLADRVVSVSRNAELRYRLEQEIPDPRLVVVPGDVEKARDLHAVCAACGPFDLIVHAAAEKHIGTGQRFAAYTHGVNVTGAVNVIEVAAAHRIPRVIALSTDKACEPINYYGETKAEAERLFVAHGHTVIRYGNVVASSGSVLPLFIQQRASGRITVTDRRMTRFFMPLADPDVCAWQVIQEPGRRPVMSAVGLARFAMAEGAGGEIFVPTIPSGTIENLAQEVGPACTIVEVGIRDGEKLHEQLIADAEVPRTYRLPDGVFVVLPQPVSYMTPVESSFRYTSDLAPQPIHLEAQEAQPCASPS